MDKNFLKHEIKTELKKEQKFEPLTPKKDLTDDDYDEEMHTPDPYDDDSEMHTPELSTLRKSLFQSDRKPDIDHEKMDDFLNRERFGSIAKKYLQYIVQTPNQVDKSRGVRKIPIGDSEYEFRIGDSKMTISGDNIIIKDKMYKGTTGLYELIFMKSPRDYTNADLLQYSDVLDTTSAHRRNYHKSGQIVGAKGHKYKNIIKKIISTGKKHSGHGLMSVSKRKTEHIYWNDPNELIDRLRLLIASQQAGHSNHNNEIISIIEELREEGIIL